MELSDRLKQIITYSNLSVRALAIKCGMNQATLDRQVKGLRSVSLETILSVLSTFPEISSEWMMRGEGTMLKGQAAPDINVERINKLVDTITTLQDTINAKNETIATLNERIKQPEK